MISFGIEDKKLHVAFILNTCKISRVSVILKNVAYWMFL